MIKDKQVRSLFMANIRKYGEARQWDKLIEEMSELMQAIQKVKYNDSAKNRENLLEELVDVEIVLGQVKLTVDEVALKEIWTERIEHLAVINPETHA